MSACYAVKSQRIPDKYKRIGNAWVDTTGPTFPYLRWNGSSLVDVRNMTEKEREKLENYERLQDIQSDGRFPTATYSFFEYNSSIQIGYPSGIRDTMFHRGNGGLSTIIQAQIPIELAAVNITPKNADQYIYRIIENGRKEVVHWQKPEIFITTKDGKYQYADWGKFDAAKEKYLNVEMYNINNYKERTECTVDWRTIKPFKYLGVFIQYTSKKSPSIISSTLNDSSSHKFSSFIETKDENDSRVRMGDSLINMTFYDDYDAPYEYRVEVRKENKKILMDVFKGRIKIPYNVWNTPGKYKITIAPRLPTRYWAGQTSKQNGRDVVMNQYATSFSFTVLPPLHQRFSFSQTQLITFFIGLALLVFFIWWYIKQRASLKIVQANFQKEKNVLELSSLRNQLNPHFIFNAITSIQNLIIKNDNAAANNYLTKLGKITRNILDTSYQEFISIEEEMKLLKEYLEMEKLRFGFQFTVEKDADLDKEIEIPAMLLQPLVENAIKHGIGNKKELGIIKVVFSRKWKNISIQIIDNGGNVDHFSNPNGYGISLVQKRIDIINQANKDKSIAINFASNVIQTMACITLRQWI